MGPIEALFDVFGLMDSVLARTIVGVGLGALYWFLVKPAHTLNEDGTVRPFKPLAGEDEDGTYFPWFFYPLLGGVLFGVFV